MAKYENQAKLGSGGFCEVWACIREEDGESFAKKVLKGKSEEGIKRFRREVRILSKLDHPRIIKVLAKRLEEPPLWYVMPLYGRSLRDVLPDLVGNVKRISKVFAAVLEGIKYAHGQGVIHRDLKPENVLLNSDEDVAISDFGLGRAVDADTSRKTYTGEWLGTYAYMPPEQLLDAKRADERSDIFSLGRILYELYSGAIPGAVQDLGSIPAGAASIVERCTKNNPDERFQNVEELQRAFELLVSRQKTISAPEDLQELLGEVITQGHATSKQADKMVRLLAECQDDTMVMHEFAVSLPEAAFSALGEANTPVAKLLVTRFAEVSVSQGWPFAYTDKIGAACARLHKVADNPAIKARLVAVALEVGVSHNRFYVMDLAAQLIAGTQEEKDAKALAHALQPLKKYLLDLGDRLQVRKLHPLIRDVYHQAEAE